MTALAPRRASEKPSALATRYQKSQPLEIYVKCGMRRDIGLTYEEGELSAARAAKKKNIPYVCAMLCIAEIFDDAWRARSVSWRRVAVRLLPCASSI